MPSAAEFDKDKLIKELASRPSIAEKFAYLHHVVRQQFSFIHLIGVTFHDLKSDCLKTFSQVTEGNAHVPLYEYSLSETKSLYQRVPDGKPLVIKDQQLLDKDDANSQHLRKHGFRSSYTVPMHQNDKLTGFVFFHSREPDSFQKDRLPLLDMIAHQFSQLVSMEHQS